MKNRVKLFALPYAGGSKYSYNSIKEECMQDINFCPIELPGHGIRIKEPLIVSIEEMVEDLFERFKDSLDSNYAFFGHSLGSLLAYLLTIKIIKEKKPLPVHLFLSGRAAPSAAISTNFHLLSDHEFLNEVNALGGTPKEILTNREMTNFFLPLLRADFQALETYQHTAFDPIDIPVTVLIGTEDKVTLKQALGWRREFGHSLKLAEFSGGHFFINNHPREIAKLMLDTLVPQYSK